MTPKRWLVALACVIAPALLAAQGKGLDPAEIGKPLAHQWTTYNGDYSGRRYSALTQINTQTVKNLTLAWVARLTGGSVSTTSQPGGGRGGGRGGGFGLIVGGEGTGDYPVSTDVTIKASVLSVDGTLYVTAPDNGWALDARDGRELWHYFWKTKGGTHIATRGFGMWKDYLYMETPDNYLVSLEAKTGKERWHKVISDFNQQYFSTMAPVVIDNHVIVGTGNDLDAPGFLQSFDPETGELQWKLYTVPMNPGDPGLETWPSLEAARHGGAQAWLGGAYDPETKLYIFGTGNPTPAYTTGRGEGDNLFTGSLIAVNVDTGKMAWYFQTAPHDMHDWDSAQTPVIANAMFNGRMRKLVMTAARNGYFFVLDRVTGEHLLTSKFGLVNNWASGLDAKGQPKRNPNKDAIIAGALVNNDVTNYPPPTFSPDTGLFYIHEQNTMRISYLMDPDPRGSMGLGGTGGGASLNWGTHIIAIDYKTGKIVWRHEINGGSSGLLSTAGGLLFLSNGQNVEAWDAATGKALWYSQIGGLSSPPETFLLDGKQHMLFTGAGALYMFALN